MTNSILNVSHYQIEDSKLTLFHCKATFIVVEKEIDLVMVGQSVIYI